MDTRQTLLTVALVYVSFLLWQAWEQDYGTPITLPGTNTTLLGEQAKPPVAASGSTPGTTPATTPGPAGELPPVATGSPASSSVPGPGQAVPSAPRASMLDSGTRVRVTTDLLRIDIDTQGGDIREADLIAYPIAADRPDDPFPLMTDKNGKIYIAQGGLLGSSGAPEHHTLSHHTQWSVARTEYTLKENQAELQVPLYFEDASGLKVTKLFTFYRDKYVVKVSYLIDNGSGEDWSGHQYAQFQRTPPTDDETSSFIYTFTGGVLSTPEDPYQKISFDDMLDAPLGQDVPGGWAAMLQHYFVGAWIPSAEDNNFYFSKALPGNRYTFGFRGPRITVPAGAEGELSARLYVGPKEQDRLENTAPSLVLTVDYGYLTVLAEPIYWLLTHIHDVVGNWGWSIIFLTLLIKAAFFHLSATSYKSMAQMRKLQPRLKQLKERYGDDRQKMNQAMMEIYKKEKINPLGGCLPILVQIPVFISLYWVLLESVEMRQAPFMLWINDLSSKDPYFVLPIIMGVSMIVQQRLNPTPLDPVQAKVMMVLPLVFTVFFAFFPSGLVLYWVVNNLVSIAQQWYITNKLIKE